MTLSAAALARHLRRLYPAARVRRCLARAGGGARPPFGLAWMETYLRHYIKVDPSQLHLDLAADLSGPARDKHLNYIAPRGSGKTAWLKGYVLHRACEGAEPLTLWLAETGVQAKLYLDSVKRELEANPRIARDYPAAAGRGAVWQASHVRLNNGCEIVCRGAGGRVLGLTARDRRPTLVIVDDGNERGDAYSPTKRQRKLDWLTKDVLPVGEPGTNYVVAGTPIHRQAIVYELYRGELAGAWRTRSYSSLARWPDRLDLWEDWSALANNLADPDRLATARGFYLARAGEMGRGAEVLWPAREPLYALMMHRAAFGRSAFETEKQCRPGTDGATEWPAEWFDWPDRWFHEWPTDLTLKLQSLDPSKGVTDDTGDYQAHVLGGIDRHGTVWLDAEFRREPVTEMVARVLDLAARFRPAEVWAESNNTMGLLMPEVERQIADRHAADRPVPAAYREVDHREPKIARIRQGGKYLGTRHPKYGPMVRVKDTPGGRTLVDQLRDVPNGEYDDGPDALATLIRRLEELTAPPG